jgi:serine/threonine-protein kinase PknG
VEVAPVAYRDPTSALLTDPHISENKRFCAQCDSPVGRSRGRQTGRTEGFCPKCGRAFSFVPKLKATDLVAGQYRVAGCLAHGGLGWIYLAQDRNVDDRWVVLKGLLQSHDESALAAAITERRFLAQVAHANIVNIFNFVEHDGAGYIVMEYVGGRSLKELRRDESGASTPIPVATAIAYILEALPALGYLHSQELLYCDFKLDNVIQVEDRVKLIDLGAVRRTDDDSSDLYGTAGYQAPEVEVNGPSIASDLYTVARTLVLLICDLPGFQDPRRYQYSLPPASEVAVFQRYPALYRFLFKGTDPDPDRRFGSAAEMAEQLLGVLRQVVAADGHRPDPAPSRLFTPELTADADTDTWRLLPVPTFDLTDPALPVITALASAPPEQMLATLETISSSPAVVYQRVRTLLELGDTSGASAALASQRADAEDWREWWWEAIIALADGRSSRAVDLLAEVADELPGELAPLLALGVAAEAAGDDAAADAAYHVVASTDASYVSALFGLSRILARKDDREAALAALSQVPSSSSAYERARLAMFSSLCDSTGDGHPSADDLVAASEVLTRLGVDPSRKAHLTRQLLIAGLELLQRSPPEQDVRLNGIALEEDSVRDALEQACRTAAKLTPDPAARVRLIDEANTYRRRTLL